MSTRTEVYLEDLLTLLQIRQLDVDLSVKTSGTQQSRIQHIGAVGGGQDDHTRVGSETVHLGQ